MELESIGQTASVSTLAIATSLLVGDEWNAEVPCGLGSFSRTGSLWGWKTFRCGTCARARVCVGTECSHGGAGGTNGSRCGGAVYRRKHGTGRASRAARHTSCGVVKNNEGMRKQNSVVMIPNCPRIAIMLKCDVFHQRHHKHLR